MFSYAIFLLVLFGGMFLIESVPNIKKPNKKVLIYAGIVITLFWGSLDVPKFSTDIMIYYNHAAKATHMDFASYMNVTPFEKGYAVFVWLVSFIFKTPQALLFVQTAFVTFSVFRFFYLNSKDVIASTAAYVCLGCFGMFSYAYRQAFAIAICLFALEAIQKKKRLLSVLLVLISTFFHQTSIVFLPVLFLQKIKLSKRNVFFFSGFMLLLALTLDRLLPKANKLFNMNYGESVKEYSSIGGIINIAVFTICFLLAYMKYRNVGYRNPECKPQQLNVIVLLCIAGFVIYACRFYALAMERVAYYFLPAFCVLFSEGLTTHTKKRIPDMFLLFLVLSVFLFLYRSTTSLGVYASIWW